MTEPSTNEILATPTDPTRPAELLLQPETDQDRETLRRLDKMYVLVGAGEGHARVRLVPRVREVEFSVPTCTGVWVFDYHGYASLPHEIDAMSADNYYAVREIGNTWWYGMGFMSDSDPDDLPVEKFVYGPYASADDALVACRNEYAEYGPYVLAEVSVSPAKTTSELVAEYDSSHCADCGARYPFGMDITLPDDQWELINGGPNGLLCGSCIARRAAKLPAAIAIRARIEFSKPGDTQASP